MDSKNEGMAAACLLSKTPSLWMPRDQVCWVHKHMFMPHQWTSLVGGPTYHVPPQMITWTHHMHQLSPRFCQGISFRSRCSRSLWRRGSGTGRTAYLSRWTWGSIMRLWGSIINRGEVLRLAPALAGCPSQDLPLDPKRPTERQLETQAANWRAAVLAAGCETWFVKAVHSWTGRVLSTATKYVTALLLHGWIVEWWILLGHDHLFQSWRHL